MNTHWVHSYRMEHAEHFPAPMEMCMDDHHTQTTERTQRQHLQDIGHAEFPPGMESTSNFPGNQFQQGNEKMMDTGTFTLGNTILNRYPALSTHTHIKGWKIPTWRHFQASTTMLMQPHRWKLPDKDQEQTQPQVEKTQQSLPAEQLQWTQWMISSHLPESASLKPMYISRIVLPTNSTNC